MGIYLKKIKHKLSNKNKIKKRKSPLQDLLKLKENLVNLCCYNCWPELQSLAQCSNFVTADDKRKNIYKEANNKFLM